MIASIAPPSPNLRPVCPPGLWSKSDWYSVSLPPTHSPATLSSSHFKKLIMKSINYKPNQAMWSPCWYEKVRKAYTDDRPSQLKGRMVMCVTVETVE